MPHIEYREYRSQDADSFIRLHDTVFPPLPLGFWEIWSRGPVTASVAVMDGEVVGTVPFCFRDFRLRSDAIVRVAWEFSVGVREDLRGKGIGSRLMHTAKQFLRDRCAAMMVYRGDEASSGYRYYARNGHADLLYARPWIWGGGSLLAVPPAQSLAWQEFLAEAEPRAAKSRMAGRVGGGGGEAPYLALFESAYGGYGGFPQRYPGFYDPAVNTIQYAEVRLDLMTFVQRDEAGVAQGYAIAGRERLSPRLHLLEIATRSGDLAIALPLLSAFCRLAASQEVPAMVMTTDSSPYVPALRVAGFRPGLRPEESNMIMAYPLEPEHLAAVAWREDAGTAGLEVSARTPCREVLIHRAAAGSARRVVLEMKEDMLARLLFGRLDLRSAVAQEMVTVVGGDDAEVHVIAQALPYTPWVYHYLDQI
jgi:GNAT superfamily N-acetyltransferase